MGDGERGQGWSETIQTIPFYSALTLNYVNMAYSAYYLIATQTYDPFILNMTCSIKMILDLVL